MNGKDLLRAPAIRTARKVIVFAVGITVILIGVALLVLPGPAIVVIPAGLAILAIEFEWARRLLRRAKGMIRTQKPTSAPDKSGPSHDRQPGP